MIPVFIFYFVWAPMYAVPALGFSNFDDAKP